MRYRDVLERVDAGMSGTGAEGGTERSTTAPSLGATALQALDSVVSFIQSVATSSSRTGRTSTLP